MSASPTAAALDLLGFFTFAAVAALLETAAFSTAAAGAAGRHVDVLRFCRHVGLDMSTPTPRPAARRCRARPCPVAVRMMRGISNPISSMMMARKVGAPVDHDQIGPRPHVDELRQQPCRSWPRQGRHRWGSGQGRPFPAGRSRSRRRAAPSSTVLARFASAVPRAASAVRSSASRSRQNGPRLPHSPAREVAAASAAVFAAVTIAAVVCGSCGSLAFAAVAA